MRGTKHGSNDLEKSLAYLHGRIEREIEQYVLAVGVPFSLAATRVAELLHPMGPQWSAREMPSLRLGAGARGDAVAEVESFGHSSHGAGDVQGSDQTGNVQGHRRKAVNSIENLEISVRRLAKRTDPLGITMYKGARKKLRALKSQAAVGEALRGRKPPSKPGPGTNRPKLTGKQKAKQKIYAARALARKLGLPQPPLPKDEAVAA